MNVQCKIFTVHAFENTQYIKFNSCLKSPLVYIELKVVLFQDHMFILIKFKSCKINE
jgi:hypothetical protein